MKSSSKQSKNHIEFWSLDSPGEQNHSHKRCSDCIDRQNFCITTTFSSTRQMVTVYLLRIYLYCRERERHKDREDKRREDYIRRESEDDTQLHCVNLFQYFYLTCSCYGLRLVFVISCFILKLCRHASCFAFMSSLCLFFPHFLHLTCVILFITPV